MSRPAPCLNAFHETIMTFVLTLYYPERVYLSNTEGGSIPTDAGRRMGRSSLASLSRVCYYFKDILSFECAMGLIGDFGTAFHLSSARFMVTVRCIKKFSP